MTMQDIMKAIEERDELIKFLIEENEAMKAELPEVAIAEYKVGFQLKKSA